MSAIRCKHCSSPTPIINDLGDVRCSGCGRDWLLFGLIDDAEAKALWDKAAANANKHPPTLTWRR